MNKQEQDKQILEGAPDNAVSCDLDGEYIDQNGLYTVFKDGYDPAIAYYGTRSLSDIRELVALRDEVAELKKQLKPRLFWDASDTEISHDSIEELMHIKFEDGAKVGDEIEIQRGVILPNEIYVITKIDDDDYSCEYELKGGDV